LADVNHTHARVHQRFLADCINGESASDESREANAQLTADITSGQFYEGE
jgi:hypothetical protein